MTDPKFLSPEECEAIQARVDAATPGPWELWDGCSWRRIGRKAHQGERPIIEPVIASDGHPDFAGQNLALDLKFAIESRTDVPNLLHTIEKLREERDELKSELTQEARIKKQVEQEFPVHPEIRAAFERVRASHNEMSIALEKLDLGEWALVQRLLQTEGSAVTIVADNADFIGPNSKVTCCGDWTGWVDKTFTGDSALDALQKAESSYRGKVGEND